MKRRLSAVSRTLKTGSRIHIRQIHNEPAIWIAVPGQEAHHLTIDGNERSGVGLPFPRERR